MLLSDYHPSWIFLISGVIILLVTFSKQTTSIPRAAVCLVTGLGVLVYLDWRFAQFIGKSFEWSAGTIWMYFFFSVEALSLADFLCFLLLLSRTTNYCARADQYEAELRSLPPTVLPDVDVWIATYNEEWPILEKTIVGCLNLDWPKDKLRIWILDDGRRDWLRQKCEEVGINHVTRPDNKGRKAGNHNNALRMTKAPFIVSLDADFIPFPNLIYRCIGFFEEDDVAIVQTPQTYYNYEPMRTNLLLQRYLPEELDMFYRVMQPCRDAWNAAFYVGSCAMLRREAFLKIGGFEDLTDIEDQVTSVKLLVHGYKTRYMYEKLSVGLAAESIAVLHDQRNRWCRGSLQILYVKYGPFGRGLNWVQRIFFLQTYWVLGSLCPLTVVVSPMLLWLFDWRLFPLANPTEVMLMPLMLFVIISVSLTWLSEKLWIPVVWQAFQLFLSVELLPTALTTLIKPFGKSLIKILPVTPKGDDANARRVDVLTFSILTTILVGTIGSFCYTAIEGRAIGQDFETIAITLWTIYAVLVLTIAIFVCFELPYRRKEERFSYRAEGWLQTRRRTFNAKVQDLSLEGARISIDNPSYLVASDALSLHVPRVGEIPCQAVRASRDGQVGVRFTDIADSVRRNLIRELLANPAAHQQPSEVALWAVTRGLIIRFLHAG